MSENVQLIWKKIEHLRRVRSYLDYSLGQTLLIMPISDWHQLTAEHHETLAAFRVRFSEFQEHLGKVMRAVAREEEQRLSEFFFKLTQAAPQLCTWFDRTIAFCESAYPARDGPSRASKRKE